MQKCVVLGVSGGIAIYKSCDLVRRLRERGLDVVVLMTASATEFVSPMTFEVLSGNRVVTDTFDRSFEYDVEHVSLAKRADLFLVAPATANVIAKFANGIADDMLTTTFLAAKCPKVIAPGMNTGMYIDPATTKNIDTLVKNGVIFIEPTTGELACHDVGTGRMEEPRNIADKVTEILKINNDYEGKRVLVTAGATIETIDGVRFLSNRSSGKMGIALAEAAMLRGARVTLITGSIKVAVPKGIQKLVNVLSTEEMLQAVMAELPHSDIVIMAAAPSDYTPKNKFDNKFKGDSLTLELIKTPDIAKKVGQSKGDKKLIIFSAETQNLEENSRKKMLAKNADMVVANDVTKEGAGFDTDTNIVTIITKNNSYSYEKQDKFDVANNILDCISNGC